VLRVLSYLAFFVGLGAGVALVIPLALAAPVVGIFAGLSAGRRSGAAIVLNALLLAIFVVLGVLLLLGRVGLSPFGWPSFGVVTPI
jgi:hypothetical protein